MNQDTKTLQRQCTWVQNLKQEKDTALIAETDLKVEIRDNGKTQEADLNQEEVTMNLDRDMIGSRLQIGEKSQTVVIDHGRPQSS